MKNLYFFIFLLFIIKLHGQDSSLINLNIPKEKIISYKYGMFKIEFHQDTMFCKKIFYDTELKVIKNIIFFNKDKIRNGFSILYYQNGKVKSIQNYVNGQSSGKYISWYENGSLKEIGQYSINDSIEGIMYSDTLIYGYEFFEFEQEPLMFIRSLRDKGQRSGVWYFFDKEGKLNKKIEYKEDKF